MAVSKIKQQQEKLRSLVRESPREYLERQTHYVWGKRFLLSISESVRAPSVELKQDQLLLQVRPGTSESRKQAILEQWYRQQLKQAALPVIARWEPLMGVKVERFFVQRMKTRWGSSNQSRHTIRLDSDLAKKPLESLEYIIVHEMAHLLEPNHNPRFVALMDRFMPKWQFYRDQLNRLPHRHADWNY